VCVCLRGCLRVFACMFVCVCACPCARFQLQADAALALLVLDNQRAFCGHNLCLHCSWFVLVVWLFACGCHVCEVTAAGLEGDAAAALWPLCLGCFCCIMPTASRRPTTAYITDNDNHHQFPWWACCQKSPLNHFKTPLVLRRHGLQWSRCRKNMQQGWVERLFWRSINV